MLVLDKAVPVAVRELSKAPCPAPTGSWKPYPHSDVMAALSGRLAVVASVCAGCKQHGVNTFACIHDMLVRVSTGPANRIRELLPDRR